MTTITMTSNRPYLIRAIYDWIVDNELTPYLLVNADYPDMQLPLDYVKEGRIIFNISPDACRGLNINHDRIVFSARFSGKVEQIVVFPAAVIAIYTKENGWGMEFPPEELSTISPGLKTGVGPMPVKKPKSHLTLVSKKPTTE